MISRVHTCAPAFGGNERGGVELAARLNGSIKMTQSSP